MKTKGPECFALFQSSEVPKTDILFLIFFADPHGEFAPSNKSIQVHVFYFPEARQVGTAPTANACEGHQKNKDGWMYNG